MATLPPGLSLTATADRNPEPSRRIVCIRYPAWHFLRYPNSSLHSRKLPGQMDNGRVAKGMDVIEKTGSIGTATRTPLGEVIAVS